MYSIINIWHLILLGNHNMGEHELQIITIINMKIEMEIDLENFNAIVLSRPSLFCVDSTILQ